MMQFQFDHHAPHQLTAIHAVVQVFKGQPPAGGAFENSLGGGGSLDFGEKGIGNLLTLNPEQLLLNIQTVQKMTHAPLDASDEDKQVYAGQALPISTNLVARLNKQELKALEDANTDAMDKGEVRVEMPSVGADLNLSIEMETGTGKTYTYIRTIYELNRAYGFCKFVIVVPSVAIREGTLKNLAVTAKDMQAIFSVPATYTVWDSSNRNGLRNFAASNAIQILVINIDSFTNDDKVINKPSEQGIRPIEFLQATRPIVIVDEPQNMETSIRRVAIHNLNPLCTLRYSATHRNPYNLISRLTPVDAYNAGLVKQIQVDGITADQNYNAAFVALKEIKKTTTRLSAKITIFVNTESGGVQLKDVSLAAGDDLFAKSNGREIYRNGFILESIEADDQRVTFSGGLGLYVGDSQGGVTDEVQKYQIERTVKWHFERAKKLHPLGIKVLSLFFIDRVANYRAAEGENTAKFAHWFEDIFEKYNKQYEGLIPFAAPDVHRGYFSQDKKGVLKDTKGTTQADEDTYSLIMKNKEELLSLDNSVQFIFSHSALREGWDNPNVFQICTLNESTSEVKKRQEVGRGLRLPVNKNGERITDKSINLLTVIANESYEAFTRTLQTEIEEETGVKFDRRSIGNAHSARVRVNLSKKELTRENYPLLFELWDKVSYHTRYEVSYAEDALLTKAVRFLKDTSHYPTVTRLVLNSSTAKIGMDAHGLSTFETSNAAKQIATATYSTPDVFGFIQSRIKVSRSAIVTLLKKCGRTNELLVNPQRFLEYVVAVFERARNEILYEGGVKYERLASRDSLAYAQALFTDELREVLADSVLAVNTEAQSKTPLDHYHISSHSTIETSFAQDCETSDAVKFFFKIPRGFKIPTPIGNYSPDWAVVLEQEQKLYFVAETKGTLDPDKLRGEEKLRIHFGKQFFAGLQTDVNYKLAKKAQDLIVMAA
jgi:type III restriction enzyme